MTITRAFILSILEYDAATGSFYWKDRPRSSFPSDSAYGAFRANFAGKQAGYLREDGYREINIRGRLVMEHRLVWLVETGSWPQHELDHVNGVCSENQFSSLRDVPHSINGRNSKRSKANRSGVTGVGWNKEQGKWRARITVDRQAILLGYFSTLDEAKAARRAAERKYDFHENHGRAS